jgi:subtilisin family serine protease
LKGRVPSHKKNPLIFLLSALPWIVYNMLEAYRCSDNSAWRRDDSMRVRTWMWRVFWGFIVFLAGIIGPFDTWAKEGVADARIQGTAAEDPVDDRGRPLYKPGELLVTFAPEAAEAEMAALHGQAGAAVVGTTRKNRIHRLRFPTSRAALAAMRRYRNASAVVHVERHAVRHPQIVPDDPLFAQQWALDRIAAASAWEFTTGGDEPLIAVIDSGADYLHPDLAANIWRNAAERDGRAGIDDDGNGFVDDGVGWDFAGASSTADDPDPDPFDSAASGHGTHVTGIIAAAGDNGEGIAGLCWKARLMVLKVKPDDSEDYDTLHILAALDYALAKGARIVNCSFGGSAYSEAEYRAFAELDQAGVLAVCAAGNGGVDMDRTDPVYPAAYDLDNIISVAAGTRTDALASFSNWGSDTVDVMAPGEAIRSTVPSGTDAAVVVGETRHPAVGMLYAAVTGEEGVTGPLVVCGEGYPQDFPSGLQGFVALVWRSDAEDNFYFTDKVANARAAGAAATIIANNRVDNLDQDGGTLMAPGDWGPVVSVTLETGNALAAAAGQSAAVVNRLVATAYGYNQGTSMAVPHVTGLAGLIWARIPDLEPRQVKAAILDGVDRLSGLSGKLVSGGRINAQKALCLAAGVCGDLSCNGRTGLEDAVIAVQLLTGRHPFACRACLTAGIDPVPDGIVSPADAAFILRMLSASP